MNVGYAELHNSIRCTALSTVLIIYFQMYCTQIKSNVDFTPLHLYKPPARMLYHTNIHFNWTCLIDRPLVAQLGIFGVTCYATGVTMRPESSNVAAPLRVISDSSFRSDLRSVKTSELPSARVTWRTLLGAKQPWPARPSPTRPQGVLDFEGLLSEIIARARMLRPLLG